MGSRAIRLLVCFGFEQADAIFACDVWDYNLASLRSFEKVGFAVVGLVQADDGAKGRATYDLALFREAWRRVSSAKIRR